MELSDVQNTITALSRTGVGIDDIGYGLYLFQQLPCKVVAHKVAESGSNSGIYYIAGDVTDFIDGYTYFWMEGRDFDDTNVFQVDSATYDSDALWTEVVVTEDANYKVESRDVGKYLCGRFDVAGANRLKNIGNVLSQMFEEGSLGNIAADTFKFVMNDEDRAFYDKMNKTGYFYEKDIATEVASFQGESEYSDKSEISTTWVKVKDLYRNDGSDFLFGYIEFVTGNAAGNKYPIVDTNGYNLKVLGRLSKNYEDTHEYHTDISVGDKVRVFKSIVYWAKFDVWAREALDEKFVNFSGRVDLSSVEVNDFERSVSVTAYSTSKDLFDKSWADLNFNSGMNLPRLSEMKALYLSASLKRARTVFRQTHPENPMSSVNIEGVGFDVASGWHMLDYYPHGLFRFDLGKWYHVYDEGSFEKSTNSVFLASNEDSTHYDNPAVLPDHATDPQENIDIERKWHGGWCRITIATEDAFGIGATNASAVNDGNQKFRKLSGLPDTPQRVLFYVNEDQTILPHNIFIYSFDNGDFVIPNLFFDLVLETDLSVNDAGTRDVTYPLGFGSRIDANFADSNVMADYPYPGRYSQLGNAEHVLQFYSFKKFNGIMLQFRNEKTSLSGIDYSSNFGNIATRFFQHAQLHFSNGTGWQKNIPVAYAGGYVVSVGNTRTDFTLSTYLGMDRGEQGDNVLGHWGDFQENMVGMKIMCINEHNFLEVREIKAVAESGSGSNGNYIEITCEAFTNIVEQYDRFLIINKDFNIKCLDLGDTFKDGVHSDVLAIEHQNDTGSEGTYFEDLNVDFHGSDPVDFWNMKPKDVLYVGHRKRFDAISLSLKYSTDPNDDYEDLSWFVKEQDFLVEYYDGIEWKVANNVAIVPTTPIGMSVSSEANLVKYKMMFDARDWHTGGYDYSDWSLSPRQAPSEIREEQIYLLRVSFLGGTNIQISHINISKVDDVNLMITWDNIPGWARNTVEVTDGKYWVDTLTTADLSLEAFGVELQCRQSYIWLQKARPVTKLEGSTGDTLYAVFQPKEIDTKVQEDVILYNENVDSNISIVPKNISLDYLLERILKNTGFTHNKSFRLHKDDFSNPDKNFLNMVGTNYDGMYPVEVGWDQALVPELLEDYAHIPSAGTYRSVCTLRDNGRYYAYCVRSDSGNRDKIDILHSEDMKDWELVTTETMASQVIAIKVLKNRDDGDYSVYVTRLDSGRYRIYAGVSSDRETLASPDVVSFSEIVTDASYNYGELDVLQLKGISDDSSAGIRIMYAVRYDGTNLDGDNYPTDDPYFQFLTNVGNNPTATWTSQFILSGANGTSPMFTNCEFAANDGSISDNKNLIALVMVFLGTDGKLYRTRPKLDAAYTSDWAVPRKINDTTTSLIGLSTVNDGYIYHRLSGSDNAYTLVPTFREANIIFGCNGSGELEGVAINKLADDFATDLFWLDKTQTMNEIDWFLSDEERITISDGVSTDGTHKRIYLGLRKPFNKILPRFLSIPYKNRVLVRYWDGITWQNFDRMYQNGRTLTDSKVNPIFGFYWDRPTDWSSDSFVNVVSDFTHSGLDQKSDSLYWVEISLPSGYASDYEIVLKGFRNCYTNLFAWKGRSLYMMENWKYMKTIYTFDVDFDKGIKIDSVVDDKSEKLLYVNTTEETHYGYREAETYVFDTFGIAKTTYPIWKNYNQYNNFGDERPKALRRTGDEQQLTCAGSSMRMFVVGGWPEEFIKDIYYEGSSFLGDAFVGYNLPIPVSQLIRKQWLRNYDWETSGGFWKQDHFINNVWIARRAGIDTVETYSASSPYRYTNSYAYLLASLTNSGLLYEELVNGPFRKIDPGYYAFIEKNHLSRYEEVLYAIQDIQSTTHPPSTPGDGELWLIYAEDVTTLDSFYEGENNSIMQYHSGDTSYSFSRPFRAMIIKDESDSDQLYFWNGYKWEALSDDEIWPGRTQFNGDKWMSLEFTLGNEGVLVPWYRDWDLKPSRFLSNNTELYWEKKRAIAYRDIDDNMYSGYTFGGLDIRTTSSLLIDFNMKATCAVELKDCSAIKDSPGTLDLAEFDGYEADYVRVIEPAAPAIAFGMYAFKDTELDGSVVRDDTTQVNPYAYSGIALYKAGARVRNWTKALYRDATNYVDVTDEMNYKRYDMELTIRGGSTPKYLYVCSNSRFFSLTAGFLSGPALDGSGIKVEVLQKDDSWNDISARTAQEFNGYAYGTHLYDNWAKKTEGVTVIWSPFIDTWQKNTVEGTEGYWARISFEDARNNVLNWVTLAGTMLWDSMVWWDDYTITSELMPTGSLSDTDKRFFDTYVPMSVEYDIINKKIIGSMWNFDPTVNQYYPFIISFDINQLYDEDDRYFWNWESNNEIVFVDQDEFDTSYNIKTLATVSHVDTKAVIVDDANPDKAPILANIKSLKSGDKLFYFGMSAPIA